MTATLEDVVVSPEAVLFRKIAETMAEVGRVDKRGRNDFHGYDYVTEADLVEEVRTKLASRNVALIPSVQSIDERAYKTDRGRESVITTVHVLFTFVDGETGAMFRADWAGQGDDPADKGLYKAYTGAVKYFLMKVFLIPTGDDPEADTGTDERAGGRESSSHRRSSSTDPASPKQIEYAKKLLKGKPVAEIRAYLHAAGAGDVSDVVTGVTVLSKAQASALIERVKSGPVPSVEHPTDVPADPAEFEHPGENADPIFDAPPE